MRRKQFRGRPKNIKPGQVDKIDIAPDENNNYISQDWDCVKLFKLFATQASYNIRILTGPKKKLKSYDKLCFETLQQISNEFQMECPQFYFLSQRKKKYTFENQILVDKTMYMSIKQSEFDPKFQMLITKLNKVIKELDEQFIVILQEILIKYIQLFDYNLDQNSVVQNIIEELYDPQNFQKFKYLLQWQTLKNITKNAQMMMAVENLYLNEMQIKKRTSQKVIQKHQKFIEKQTRQLNEQKIMEPIQYLIINLVEIFNKIMRKN